MMPRVPIAAYWWIRFIPPVELIGLNKAQFHPVLLLHYKALPLTNATKLFDLAGAAVFGRTFKAPALDRKPL